MSVLEIYCLPDIAPGGSTTATHQDESRVDLQGKWPIGLLRTFMPSPEKYHDQDIQPGAKMCAWWANHAIKTLEVRDFAYDTVEGRAEYGVSLTGGSFDFYQWLGVSKKINGEPKLNSSDLTALLEAAFLLLPKSSVHHVSWTCMTPDSKLADVEVFRMIPFGIEKTPESEFWKHEFTPFFSGTGKFECLVFIFFKTQKHRRGWNGSLRSPRKT